jgi:serine protease AprX
MAVPSQRSICVSCLAIIFVVIARSALADNPSARLTMNTDGAQTMLALDGAAPFHATADQVRELRLVEIPDSPGVAAVWQELKPDGTVGYGYAISLDGRKFARARETDYQLELRYAVFDPTAGAPSVSPALRANAESELYIVQFATPPLEAYRRALHDRGATGWKFLPNHACVVKMSPAVRAAVAQLPFVRWVGPVEPAYKIEEEILSQLQSGQQVEPRRYSIMVYERGAAAQDRVSREIAAIGGEVHGTTPGGFRLEATLNLEQVRTIASLDDVMFIDRKGPVEADMDIVREIGGADFIESTLGFTGQGVRAEVADTELDVTHTEWSAPPIIHIAGDAGTDHGTSVYGILFARGASPQARGLIPSGVGIFAESSSLLGGGPTRYQRTAEIVDPNGPYRCVFQTNSTGDGRTTQYTTISAEMDDILLLNDILVCQSQSNAGSQDSRPQAWAKNIVSVGAFNHYDTLSRADDHWGYSGSIGPASDGRIKPTLSHFYDETYTTTAGGGYTQFGGTSGATPIVAGHFGLLFQMWHEGVFPGFGGGESVFASRPHMTTAKALLVNSAYRYDWLAGGPNGDIDRFKQGWGMPDLQELYNLREKILIVDESEVLAPFGSGQYSVTVETGEPNFRATLVYADPPCIVGAAHHRINDLSLRVTSPDGTTYWGNHGLTAGNFTTPGGSSDTLNTEENVFVANPATGQWRVEVLADEINEDGHLETPEVDADYALVVTGGLTIPPPLTMQLVSGPSGFVPANTSPPVEVEIMPGSEAVVPGSETVFYRYDSGAFQSQPLVHGNGNLYTATLPLTYCAATPQYYFSAESSGGSVVYLPERGAEAPLSATVGTFTVILDDNFESDLGWTVVNDPSLASGTWERGVPAGDGTRGDPIADYDDSGQCFLTGNQAGNWDVDGGPTRLVSPRFDLSAMPNATLRYARWWANDDKDSDPLDVEVSNDGGATWVRIERVVNVSPGWVERTVQLNDYISLTSTVVVRFSAMDRPNNSIDEAAVDAVRITDFSCVDHRAAGDLNCDGLIDTSDIDPFVLALIDPAAHAAAFPGCDHMLADTNRDGLVNGFDIDAFVLCLTGDGCPS